MFAKLVFEWSGWIDAFSGIISLHIFRYRKSTNIIEFVTCLAAGIVRGQAPRGRGFSGEEQAEEELQSESDQECEPTQELREAASHKIEGICSEWGAWYPDVQSRTL